MNRIVDRLGKLIRGKLAHASLALSAATAITFAALTPAWALTFTTLYNFCSQSGCADGSNPVAGLMQARNGNLYGTTEAGGSVKNWGTLFQLTLGGTLTTLVDFTGLNGINPGLN